VVPKTGEPTLLVQAVEQAMSQYKCIVEDVRTWAHGDDYLSLTAQIVGEHTSTSPRIGYQGDSYFLKVQYFEGLRKRLPECEFVDMSGALAERRLRKSPAELAYVRRAGEIADFGIQAAIEAVHLGVRECEIAAAMYETLCRRGSEYASSPFQISSGPHSAFLHGTPSEREVRSGEPVTMELAGVVARYHVNVLRTAVVGQPDPLVLEMHSMLSDAVSAAQQAVAPGVPVGEIDRLTRKITDKYDRYRLHRTGYGLEAGYPPAWMGCLSISTSDSHVLEPGFVFSIEPTIAMYDRDVGVVLGNCVLVTEAGCEVLTKTSLELALR